MTRVLLIGGSGQLGSAVSKRWEHADVVAPSHAELPVEDARAVAEAVERIDPSLVINAAAFHDVDACEIDPERAFAVNAVAVGRVAELARERGAVFVTIGTDYVFDGRKGAPYVESDAPNPLSVYGLSKLAGEHLALRGGGRTFVVRTCGVYGPAASRAQRHTFIDRIVAQSQGGMPLRVVTDVVASPTYSEHLAQAIHALVQTEAYGLYHAADAGPVSWYEFAREALRCAGSEAEIEPIAAEEWKATAVRPRYSALDSGKLRGLGFAMPPWQAGIAAYLSAPVR